MRISLSQRVLRKVLVGATVCALACSSGAMKIDDQTDDPTPPPPPPPLDLSVPPADMSVPPPPPDLAVQMVQPCTWKDRFLEVYHHAWSSADVAFVTTDGAVARGIDKLDFAAQKSQIPDIVKV